MALIFSSALLLLLKYMPLPDDEKRRPSMVRLRGARLGLLGVYFAVGAVLVGVSYL
ncbi:hypothetical protein ACXR2U_13170 [Jatrophihabitans sp. YIM 134969]